MSSSAPLIPDFKWAENNDNIFLTVEVSDAKDLKVDIKDDQIVFAANSQGKDYALDLKLKKKIDAAVGKKKETREERTAARSTREFDAHFFFPLARSLFFSIYSFVVVLLFRVSRSLLTP